jgi:hypothetical protein
MNFVNKYLQGYEEGGLSELENLYIYTKKEMLDYFKEIEKMMADKSGGDPMLIKEAV